MKVKQLIAALKKMPQNLEVGMAHHDNAEEECAAWIGLPTHFIKDDFRGNYIEDEDMFKAMPEECVILRC